MRSRTGCSRSPDVRSPEGIWERAARVFGKTGHSQPAMANLGGVTKTCRLTPLRPPGRTLQKVTNSVQAVWGFTVCRQSPRRRSLRQTGCSQPTGKPWRDQEAVFIQTEFAPTASEEHAQADWIITVYKQRRKRRSSNHTH